MTLDLYHDFVVEVCVDSLESAYAACNAGASRLEICGNIALGGGTTPSLGLVKTILRALPKVDVMVMIRPRVGDFCYSDYEYQTMLEDIAIFKNEGINGVVFGILTPAGSVDVPRTEGLVQTALPLQVTFHRAFDMTQDGEQAMRDVARVPGIQRILTSGLSPSAPLASKTLRSLHEINHRLELGLILLIGSGINAETVTPLLAQLYPEWNVSEIHLSGGEWVEGACLPEVRKPEMNMGAGRDLDWKVWMTLEGRVRLVFNAIVDFKKRVLDSNSNRVDNMTNN